ncbi:MAG: hypothetical protein AAFZ11_00960 [Pseudomonadota bacterium]
MSKDQIAAQRLYLTADKQKLVADGDKAAATLYATPGTTIPESACGMFGLVDGKLPAKKAPTKKAPTRKAPASKSKPAPANKEQAPAEDKGGKAPADKAEGGAA